MDNKTIRGIATANPVDIERDYILKTVDYAIDKGFDHYQFIGPIHNPVRGNVDGMTLYKKYSQFNGEKDMKYLNYNLDVVNNALDKLHGAGIKSYMWHHELDLPYGFAKAFPEVLNSNGDIEVSHPLVQDFLENKLADFFEQYPKMDGLILTLHETKVPVLKLKNQKLDKIGRVKHITKILFDTCAKFGKQLIVRPFSSIDEDYDMMLKAYEEISSDLIVMDKWTQFDWSLTLPHNKFFNKIKHNPLFVETDIFGEYFGKGRLPIMLKNHITEKYNYCESFSPIGYVNRIDRAGRHPFGTVNEVNLYIMHAQMSGENVDEAIDEFFNVNYPEVADELKEIMKPTEDLNRSLLNAQNYYFSQGSYLPEINHSKNHFFFEMMKKDCDIASDEWFVPKDWKRSSVEAIIEEKQDVVNVATDLFERVKKLEGRISEEKYRSLFTMFANQYYSAKAWKLFVDILFNYIKYFETRDQACETALFSTIDEFKKLSDEGRKVIDDDNEFNLRNYVFDTREQTTTEVDPTLCANILEKEVTASFNAEKAVYFGLQDGNHVDAILCGGGMEGHRLKKEVNFSDTMIINGKLCRITGNRLGAEWSQINGHGWFSYEVKVKPNAKNLFTLEMGSLTGKLAVQVIIGESTFTVEEDIDKTTTKKFTFTYDEKDGNDKVRIKVDRFSPYTPQIYTITVD